MRPASEINPSLGYIATRAMCPHGIEARWQVYIDEQALSMTKMLIRLCASHNLIQLWHLQEATKTE